MRFTVTWRPDAEAKLARIWLDSEDREAVQAASDQFDEILRHSPELMGHPFFGDRVFFISPLAVVFEVSEPDRLVRIWDVWLR